MAYQDCYLQFASGSVEPVIKQMILNARRTPISTLEGRFLLKEDELQVNCNYMSISEV